jgi:hypothetical protein
MKLHAAGAAHAKSLIAAGKVDVASAFAGPDQPTGADNMHLGADNDAPAFVFGKTARSIARPCAMS